MDTNSVVTAETLPEEGPRRAASNLKLNTMEGNGIQFAQGTRMPLSPQPGAGRPGLLTAALRRLAAEARPAPASSAAEPLRLHLLVPVANQEESTDCDPTSTAAEAGAQRPPATELAPPREPRLNPDSIGRAMARQQGQATGRDRREFPRRESGCTVTVCRKTAARSLTAHDIDWQLHTGRLRGKLLDISLSGLAFTLTERLEADEQLFVRIRHCTFEAGTDVSADVIRVAEAESGQWKVFCRLQRKLSLDQVQILGKHVLPSAVI
jgi:hypothetical protein